MKNYLFLLIIITSVLLPQKEQRKYLWFDATANFQRLSYKDSVKYYLDYCKKKGFTDIVLDVKPITGEVLYDSKIAPKMIHWNNFTRKNNFDFVKTFISESHKRKLRIHLSINVFVAGHNFFDRGIVYDGKSEWQTLLNTDSGFVPITKLKHKYSAMLNPHSTEVQLYEFAIINELIKKYTDIDGIILDRTRFDGLEADFNFKTKLQFEKYLKLKVDKWPEDIFTYKIYENGTKEIVKGKYFKEWIFWRTNTISNFVKMAKDLVKSINKKIEFEIYVGSWYPIYYELGVNWASKEYDPALKYEWATPEYKNTGYAEQLDYLLTGNYYFEVNKSEVDSLNEKNIQRGEAGQKNSKEYWYSVEGAAEIVNEVTKNVIPVIGSLYVEQYKDHNEQFQKAISMCLAKSNGIMIFDIVHLINFGWLNKYELK